MFRIFYVENKNYRNAFTQCNDMLYGEINGFYFHRLKICMANHLRWNLSIDYTKVYYFLFKITQLALDNIGSCKFHLFDDVYIDQSETFLEEKSSDVKECIGLIYKYTTATLRGLSNFTAQYGHHTDILFYYKSGSYRDHYRQCLREYITKSVRNSRNLYDLLKCSNTKSLSDEFLVSFNIK